MKTASSKSAEKISNIKRELKNLQRQHTTSDAQLLFFFFHLKYVFWNY